MKCPLSGRRGWLHAGKHGELSEGRGGAGDENAGSDFASDGKEDQLVASSRNLGHWFASKMSFISGRTNHREDTMERWSTSDEWFVSFVLMNE
jgi:hypothetical protein